MNVYQKVLVKLYEETGGRDSKTVYLKDIVKDLGFFPSYADIKSQMSHDGWLTDGVRSGEVNITHWGVREAKNLLKGGTDNTREQTKAVNKEKSEVKVLMVMAEELVEDITPETFSAVENKLKEVTKVINDMKELI